ncbi:MAG TPA: cytochrome c [Terriglobales bacterium]|nr:cytochrome c [Terriglobales bacterium]
MRTAKIIALSSVLLLGATAIVAKAGDGSWLMKVPQAARVRPNPMAADPESTTAGAKLFQQNCASCHGRNAQGRDKHPNLHSERLKTATPGELEWLLKNGSLKNGMPSWSRLPEEQRWQLVKYLKSLE